MLHPEETNPRLAGSQQGRSADSLVSKNRSPYSIRQYGLQSKGKIALPVFTYESLNISPSDMGSIQGPPLYPYLLWPSTSRARYLLQQLRRQIPLGCLRPIHQTLGHWDRPGDHSLHQQESTLLCKDQSGGGQATPVRCRYGWQEDNLRKLIVVRTYVVEVD